MGARSELTEIEIILRSKRGEAGPHLHFRNVTLELLMHVRSLTLSCMRGSHTSVYIKFGYFLFKKLKRSIILWLCIGNKLEQARLEKGNPTR